MHRRHTRSFIGLMLALGVATIVNADDYDLSWHTIDAGGEIFSTGPPPADYQLGGTIGQHDAGGPMTGGTYELTGGFWPGAAAVCPCPGPPCGRGLRRPESGRRDRGLPAVRQFRGSHAPRRSPGR